MATVVRCQAIYVTVDGDETFSEVLTGRHTSDSFLAQYGRLTLQLYFRILR
jgi:hypothetical protein